MFNSQACYFKEHQANFKAVSSRQVQDRNHCDTINCDRDNGIKVIYLRNIVNNQIVEQKLCRDCRRTRHQKLFNTYYSDVKGTNRMAVVYRYYY